MKYIHILTLTGLLAMTGHALAQGTSTGARQPVTGASAMTPTWTEAEVRKVDKAARKITLKHAEIKNLDMPPMSMVFQVQRPALLDKVQAGDKVRFTADKVNGAITVLTLEKLR